MGTVACNGINRSSRRDNDQAKYYLFRESVLETESMFLNNIFIDMYHI